MFGPRKEPQPQDQLLKEVHRVARIGTWEVTAEEELLWSDETLQLFGVEPEAFRGSIEEFFALIHPDDVERVRRVDDFEGSGSDYFSSEYRIIRSDGELRHIRQTAIVLLDALGRPQGFSGMVQNVSEQVETEACLRQAQKMETIGQLSGGVAHDFNNILAAIMGAAELLQQEEKYDPELIESIISSAKRGGELTHRLLAFARKQPLRTTKVDVVNSVESIASMLDRLTGTDIRLELHLSQGTWPIEADPARLEEALLNLTVNARDAIDGAGKIILSCRNRSRVVRDGFSQDFVEIDLRDTGAGMTAAVLQQARDPFFTTKPVGKGTGLGLSMVEGFVNQSGGEMDISSEPGGGTRVSLLMPRTRHDAQIEQESTAEIIPGDGESVLIIEDNKDLAALLYQQLAGLNYQVTLASNGQAALQAAERQSGFEVVLSDIMLADGERGPHVVKELLSLYPRTRAIFMTGDASNEQNSVESAVLGGVVLRKPFDLEQLVFALRRVVRSDRVA